MKLHEMISDTSHKIGTLLSALTCIVLFFIAPAVFYGLLIFQAMGNPVDQNMIRLSGALCFMPLCVGFFAPALWVIMGCDWLMDYLRENDI